MSRNDTEREFTALAIILMQSKPDAAAAAAEAVLPAVVEPVLCVVVVVVVAATLLLPDGWSGNGVLHWFLFVLCIVKVVLYERILNGGLGKFVNF